jgi:rhodanese-related sulfurtransferase
MSAIAAEALIRLGYTRVFNLDGGMVAWQRVGYPLRRR